jgi:hypothetical protein
MSHILTSPAIRKTSSETVYCPLSNICAEFRRSSRDNPFVGGGAICMRIKVEQTISLSGHLEKFLSPSRHESDSVTARGHGRMERAVMGQKGFFDVERRLEAISALGDPVAKANIVLRTMSAQITASLSLLREPRNRPAGLPTCRASLASGSRTTASDISAAGLTTR